jgi:hypothetical protein
MNYFMSTLTWTMLVHRIEWYNTNNCRVAVRNWRLQGQRSMVFCLRYKRYKLNVTTLLKTPKDVLRASYFGWTDNEIPKQPCQVSLSRKQCALSQPAPAHVAAMNNTIPG